MELTKNQKSFIEEKYDSMDPRNIEFEGSNHNGADDAFNTAKLLYQVLKN